MDYSTIYHCLHFLSTCHHIIIIEDIMDPSSSCLHHLSVVSTQHHSMEHTHCIFNQVTLLCTEGHQRIIKNFVTVCCLLHIQGCHCIFHYNICLHTTVCTVVSCSMHQPCRICINIACINIIQLHTCCTNILLYNTNILLCTVLT